MQKPIPALQFEGLTKRYPRRDGPGLITVLDELTLANGPIMPGQFVTLVGPSGCGKSTLFNLILGSLDPTEGSVLVDDRPVAGPGPDRGIVYQHYGLFQHKTVLENVMLGVTIRWPVYWRLVPSLRARYQRETERAMQYLARVKIDVSANKYPHELSGGMRQRVAIAQALFTHPRIILMDEPFGALDPGTRQDAQRFLIELWEEFGMTVLFVTHALDEAVYLGTRLLALSQHWEHEEGPHRTDNGSRFVMDVDLSGHVAKRHTMPHEAYVSQFTELLDQIAVQAMDERMRQHVRDFHSGPPEDLEVLTWTEEGRLEERADA